MPCKSKKRITKKAQLQPPSRSSSRRYLPKWCWALPKRYRGHSEADLGLKLRRPRLGLFGNPDFMLLLPRVHSRPSANCSTGIAPFTPRECPEHSFLSAVCLGLCTTVSQARMRGAPESESLLTSREALPVSYTHLTLPTKRIV